MRADLIPRTLPTFGSAPSAGANTGSQFRVGTALYYDNGTALVPLDLQGDWQGRTVTNADGVTATNDNVVYMNNASVQAFTVGTSPAFPLNKLIDVVPIGAAAVTLTAGSGVSFEGLNVSGSTVSITTPVSLIQRATNVWRVIGVPYPTVAFQASYTASGYNLGHAAFNTMVGLVPSLNVGGGTWDGGAGAGSLWTVPVTGSYLYDASIRFSDNTGVFDFGMGLNKVNGDSADLVWDNVTTTTSTGSGVSRKTFTLSKTRRFVVGDQLRLFGYCDASADQSVIAASMSLLLVSRG